MTRTRTEEDWFSCADEDLWAAGVVMSSERVDQVREWEIECAVRALDAEIREKGWNAAIWDCRDRPHGQGWTEDDLRRLVVSVKCVRVRAWKELRAGGVTKAEARRVLGTGKRYDKG